MRKLLFICLILTYSSLLYSQKRPEHEKKIYVASDGKLFVQKSLPVYLKLSTSVDNKDSSYVLHSSNAPRYSNPMYFDTEGRNTFRHPWVTKVDSMHKSPNEDDIFEVYVDSRPPSTSISYGKSSPVKEHNKFFINDSAEITLSAKDELAGVDKIMISIDSAEYKEYTAPMKLDLEKEYVLKFYSFDHVGNVEPIRTLFLAIDKSKPKSAYEVKGDHYENVLAGNAQIIIKTEDNSSGIAKILCKLDDNPEKAYVRSLGMSALTQGEHRLIFYSEDHVGNIEEQNVFDFYVDKTPPTIIQEIIGKSFMVNGKEFSSGRSQLKLTTIDNKAGVKAVYYSINNSEFTQYEKPVLLNVVNGSMSVKAYAIDNVNNRSQAYEEANASKISYIDLSGPQLNYNFLGPFFVSLDTVYISSKTKIQLKAYDKEAGLNNIQYLIDSSELQTYTAPFFVEKEHLHTIQYIGTDNVDNTSSSSIKVFVDNAGPLIHAQFSTPSRGKLTEEGNDIMIYPGHVSLFIAATDIEVGYDHMTYSLNGARSIPFTGYITGLAKKNEVIVKAYDKLGNETVTTLKFELY